MSFLAFRSFQTASVKMMNDRPAGQRLNIHNMTSFKGLSKAISTKITIFSDSRRLFSRTRVPSMGSQSK